MLPQGSTSSYLPMFKFIDTLQLLGLSKNESEIYETLLEKGESSVAKIAIAAKIHRRNVYDTIDRLVRKGLVFEILEGKENQYQAVEPQKLLELLGEKQQALVQRLPEMEQLYKRTQPVESVFIYRGVEGWKNYMRDILRLGQDDYVIGAKGAWSDPKIKLFTELFASSARKKHIKIRLLYDHDSAERAKADAIILKAEYRILPPGVQTPSAVEVFGDHVVIFTDVADAKVHDDLSMTVLISQKAADSFKIWFNMMWKVSSAPKG